MKVYIAAPLFNEAERAFNEKIDAVIRECGHETFLPQRAGGCVADLPDEIEGISVSICSNWTVNTWIGAIPFCSCSTVGSLTKVPALN